MLIKTLPVQTQECIKRDVEAALIKNNTVYAVNLENVMENHLESISQLIEISSYLTELATYMGRRPFYGQEFI